MATPKITTLPESIRGAAAVEAERVVEFDEGDFFRTVDAITPLLAGYYIEQGAKAAVAAMTLHFCDENGESYVPDITTSDLESFEVNAVAGVLEEAGIVPFVSQHATFESLVRMAAVAHL